MPQSKVKAPKPGPKLLPTQARERQANIGRILSEVQEEAAVVLAEKRGNRTVGVHHSLDSVYKLYKL